MHKTSISSPGPAIPNRYEPKGNTPPPAFSASSSDFPFDLYKFFTASFTHFFKENNSSPF